MPPQEEHRRFPRCRTTSSDISLKLVEEAAPAEVPLRLWCRNVSPTGLGVVFPRSIRPDTDVELWIKLPDDHTGLHLYGTVAWCAAPEGEWQAGIALNLERGDGASWATRFDVQGLLRS